MRQIQDFTEDPRFRLMRDFNAQVLRHPFDPSASIGIQHNIAKHVLPEVSGRMLVPTTYGFPMMIDLDQSHTESMQGSIERNIYFLGTYEAGTLEVIRRSLAISDTPGAFIEVGAHNGLMSIFASREGAANVFSFEPNPAMYEVLQANIDLNNAKNIKTFSSALGDTEGAVSIALDSENSGAAHVTELGIGNIPLDTLDHVAEVEDIVDVRLILMDVEGYEQNVLAGAEKTISTYKPDLIIEYNPADPDDRVTDVLKRHGYKVYILENSRHLPGRLVPFTPTANRAQADNYFCFQPERAKLLGLE